ncbi:MAG: SNF2-related protein, partial [Verrucomicrobiota bacterium]
MVRSCMDSEAFPQFNEPAAQQFLKELPQDTRHRGESLQADGAIQDLRCTQPGLEYVADIQGDTLWQTTLSFDPDTQSWWETCTCPAGGGCEHAAGAMLTLLSERAAAMAKSDPKDRRKKSKTAATPTPIASGVLARQASEALGRALSRPEAEFVRKVEERFARLREKPHLNVDDLIALGFRIGGHTWEKLDLWPAPPRDEIEFWNYLALAAEERDLKWPEFLRPITRFADLQLKVIQWRRSRDVDRWRTLLNNLQLAPPEESSGKSDELELRMRFTDKEAVVEYRKPGALDWSAIKSGKFREFDEKQGDQLSPDVALLWQPLAQRARYGYPINLVYDDQQTRRLLNRILRLPALEPFLVGSDGEPLGRPGQPLQWRLDPAADESDDYQLRLIQPDGSPAPKALSVLQGRPTLYLTSQEVWLGPPVEDRVLDPSVATPIPAPSLEAPAGIRFLQYLGVPLPQRIAERVRTVALQPVLHGELRTIAFGNDTEYAVFDALALNPDGTYAERWNGSSWLDAKISSKAGTADGAEESLVTYDRSGLPEVTRLLEPAGFKWDFARQRWLMRVTAKFPDAFMSWLSSVPPQVRLELKGELGSFQNGTVAGRLRLDVVEAGMDWFDLKVVLDVTDTQLTPEEIKALLDARGKWVRLGSKGWRKLEFKLSPEEDAQLAKLGINPHELTSESQRFHALQLADSAAKDFVGKEAFEAIRRRADEIQARVTPEIPKTLQAELRPYQKDGFHFLCYLAANRFGGILADDMGLGKTLQTLGWIAWLRETLSAQVPEITGPAPAPAATAETRKKRGAKGAAGEVTVDTQAASTMVLVICPKSVTDNWRAEAERFVPHLRVAVWRSEKVKDLPAQLGTADLHIINYNQLRTVGEALSQIRFGAVILDEGQYIKNPTSITAQLARGLQSHHRLVLSGTPIENKLLDLWSLMSFAMPSALGSRNEFTRLFESKGDPLARQRLAARVRPFLLRRTKSQVAKDLPDRIEEHLFCDLEGEQRTLYK